MMLRFVYQQCFLDSPKVFIKPLSLADFSLFIGFVVSPKPGSMNRVFGALMCFGMLRSYLEAAASPGDRVKPIRPGDHVGNARQRGK